MKDTKKSHREEQIAYSLLQWYDQNKRDLPWRLSAQPYAVWISEIMAQQTRISALLPYYKQFMEKFPTVKALAKAKQDEVLKAWEGLGYYSRARNLHKSAIKIMSDYHGQLPANEKELLSLPGIGKYTAGAILSIAFNKPFAAVDGNVLRVFSRLENSSFDIAKESTKQVAAAFVRGIMPKERISCFTQSLMELGALVCLPKNPICLHCPLVSFCRARQEGLESELPVKSAAKPLKHLDITVLIICNEQGQVLMRRRTEKLLNGLWEYCLIDAETDIEKHLAAQGFMVDEVIPIGKANHVFTHIVWHMDGYFCRVKGTTRIDNFFDKQELEKLTIPSAFRFYSEWLAKQGIKVLVNDQNS